MLVSKIFVVFFVLCFVHNCISKPANGNEVTEGRGVITSIWGWMTYPFSWWYSGETEQPVTGHLSGTSTTNYPSDIIDIRSHNVTIWCNDQTCNTMKCDKTHCRNITCNIYDTDFRGECREYNIISDSEELTVQKITETTQKVIIPSKPTETYIVTSLPNNTQEKQNTTQEKQNTTQEKQNTNQEKQYTTQEKQNTTQEKQNTTQEKQNTNQEKQNTTQEKQNTTQEKGNNTAAEEHPLELEAVLSSTVNKLNLEKHSESKEDLTIREPKV